MLNAYFMLNNSDVEDHSLLIAIHAPKKIPWHIEKTY
jgi:hypothetical protein